MKLEKRRKSSIYWGSLIILILILSPYLLFISQLFPENIESYQTVFGEINSGYFGSIQVYIHFIFAKFVPLLLLSILYVTNKYWWSSAILVPISVYLFQLIGVLHDGNNYADEVEFIYTIPILVIVSFLLFVIRRKLLIYTKAFNLKAEMDEMIEKKTK